MRLLLDTHVLIWALSDPKQLSAQARADIASPENSITFSAASMWELAIKAALGRLKLTVTLDEILGAALDAGFEELPLRSNVALRVANLPMHHGDPFDRLLIAQAISEPARLLTADAILARYSDLVSVVAVR